MGKKRMLIDGFDGTTHILVLFVFFFRSFMFLLNDGGFFFLEEQRGL